jgi:hypothetical protein
VGHELGVVVAASNPIGEAQQDSQPTAAVTAPPAASTSTATGVTSTTATLHASVTPQGLATTASI